MSQDERTLVAGRVLARGNPSQVTCIRDDPQPHDYTGERHGDALFAGNMALRRSRVLALGAFDQRVKLAEDNDLCYRWLRAGLQIRYEPDVVVWHHDWRTHAELERLYVSYAYGLGLFYAKHLRSGDITMLRFIARDIYAAVRAAGSAIVLRRPRWSDPRRGIFRGLPRGIWRGWRLFGSHHDVALASLLSWD